MSLRILMLTLACVAFAAVADAGPLWLGPQLHFPLPGHAVGDAQLGVDAGVTLTKMKNARFGVGADLLYHYWPASEDYKSAYDRHLMQARFETIAGTAWALSAFQATGHVKLVPWPEARLAPWIQTGAGVYRIGHNLVEARPPDTYSFAVGPNRENVNIEPGVYGSVGFDFRSCSRIALGLDASYHYLQSTSRNPSSGKIDVPDFSAFTIGAHVLFGWK